jgi:Flp pilus assembly protein TadD
VNPAPALVFFLAASSAPATAASSGWTRARSAHFEVLTDAGAPVALHAAERLEALRAAFAALLPPRPGDERPLVAIVLASGSSFEELVPRKHRRPREVAGFFQGCGEWDAIVARVATERRGPFTSLDHEYAHVALNRSLAAQPLWAAEGLAELLSGGELETGEGRFGSAVPELERPAGLKPTPLATLLRAQPDSSAYLAGDEAAFYPSSWALARWLVARQGLAGLRTLLDELAAADDPVAAFEARLGPLAAVQAAMLDVPREPLLQVGVDTSAVPQLNEPSRAELDHRLGELLLREGELARSKQRLERARDASPADTAVALTLAELMLRSGQRAEARREVERALAASPDDPRALLYDARVRVDEARSAGTPIPPAEEERLVSRLERALVRAPGLYEAALMLVELRPQPYAERRKALAPVFEQDPSRTEVALALALLDRKARDLAGAEAVLRRAREAAREPAYRFLCDRELQELAAYQAATAEVRGRLIHVECRPDGGLRFTVDAPPSVLLLEAESSRAFMVYGAGEAGGAELVCGLQDRPLVVRYERMEPPRGGVQGRVVWLSLPDEAGLPGSAQPRKPRKASS